MRSTELSATTKLSAEHETPPIANVLLGAGKSVPLMFRTVLSCWLQGKIAGSFAFFASAFALEKCKCACNVGWLVSAVVSLLVVITIYYGQKLTLYILHCQGRKTQIPFLLKPQLHSHLMYFQFLLPFRSLKIYKPFAVSLLNSLLI